jgi:hypothetical protein
VHAIGSDILWGNRGIAPGTAVGDRDGDNVNDFAVRYYARMDTRRWARASD